LQLFLQSLKNKAFINRYLSWVTIERSRRVSRNSVW